MVIKMRNDIVIIGGDSEIAKEFNKIARSNKSKILDISRKKESATLKVHDYISSTNDIIEEIKKLENPIIIFFNGFLAENRPVQFPSGEEILNTIQINFLIPYLLTKEISSKIDCEKFVYISSIAAIKPRMKNYIYGLSKRNLEISIKKLGVQNYLIFRFGLVKTKMSKGHDIPPFSLDAKKAAMLIYKNLNKNGIKYPNKGLSFIGKLLNLLPIKIINYLEKNINTVKNIYK